MPRWSEARARTGAGTTSGRTSGATLVTATLCSAVPVAPGGTDEPENRSSQEHVWGVP